MEHDIYDSLRLIATTCEKMEDLKGEDFVDMLVSYAETFDPNTQVSLTVKSHSSTQDILAMLKNAQEIQMLLLRLAIKLMKISKEVE